MSLPLRMPSHKRIASLFLLPQCEMACSFCASETAFDAMDLDQGVALLEALRGTSIEGVVLGGGEPLLWGPLPRLADHAKALGFHVQLCTNGLHLEERLPDLASVDRFILPLEATDPDLHDALRIHRDGGHHRLVLDLLARLASEGREVTLSTVLTSRNLTAVEPLVEGLRRGYQQGWRIHAWHLYRFLPTGRGGAAHGAELAVDPAAYRAACDLAQSLGLPFRVYRRDDMLRASTVAFFWFEGGALRTGGGG